MRRPSLGTIRKHSFVVPALAVEPLDVMQGSEPNSCSASAHVNLFKEGSAGIQVYRSRYLLGFMMVGTAPQIPDGDYAATLKLDDHPPVKVKTHGSGGVYLIVLDIKLSMALRNVKQLTLTVRGGDNVFDGSRLDEAMDAAAKCVGIPKVTDLAAIGWGTWSVRPGEKGDLACHATRHGLQVDSMASLHPDGRFTFGPAWMGWTLQRSDKVKATFEIDEDTPVPVQLTTGVKTASYVVDKGFLDRLEKASSITWHLPWGEFYSEVDGIADMRKSLADCLASRSEQK